MLCKKCLELKNLFLEAVNLQFYLHFKANRWTFCESDLRPATITWQEVWGLRPLDYFGIPEKVFIAQLPTGWIVCKGIQPHIFVYESGTNPTFLIEEMNILRIWFWDRTYPRSEVEMLPLFAIFCSKIALCFPIVRNQQQNSWQNCHIGSRILYNYFIYKAHKDKKAKWQKIISAGRGWL